MKFSVNLAKLRWCIEIKDIFHFLSMKYYRMNRDCRKSLFKTLFWNRANFYVSRCRNLFHFIWSFTLYPAHSMAGKVTLLTFFLWKRQGKRAFGSPDGKWLAPPTTPCNTRGATGALPAFKVGWAPEPYLPKGDPYARLPCRFP